MLNGFWTVAFQAPTNKGAGVMTITDNKVVGGDTSFTYIGTVSLSADGSVSGELAISRHSSFLPSVLPGQDNYTLLISGKASEGSFALTGRVKGKENLSMDIQGKRKLTA